VIYQIDVTEYDLDAAWNAANSLEDDAREDMAWAEDLRGSSSSFADAAQKRGERRQGMARLIKDLCYRGWRQSGFPRDAA
jgi:hypothetical protein